MLSKGKTKTAAEKAWLADVVDFARNSSWLHDMYDSCCDNPHFFEIDHICGAQAKRKINGISVKVGEFAIMCIPWELHNIRSRHLLNRTLSPARYRAEFGHETKVWRSMLDAMVIEGYELPFDNDLIEAVMR